PILKSPARSGRSAYAPATDISSRSPTRQCQPSSGKMSALARRRAPHQKSSSSHIATLEKTCRARCRSLAKPTQTSRTPSSIARNLMRPAAASGPERAGRRLSAQTIKSNKATLSSPRRRRKLSRSPRSNRRRVLLRVRMGKVAHGRRRRREQRSLNQIALRRRHRQATLWPRLKCCRRLQWRSGRGRSDRRSSHADGLQTLTALPQLAAALPFRLAPPSTTQPGGRQARSTARR
ncbi:MAG: hypothetical protein QOD74_1246, partial [Variibacter sp.]|nr:hypothetical protein [Variibacter sp.]